MILTAAHGRPRVIVGLAAYIGFKLCNEVPYLTDFAFLIGYTRTSLAWSSWRGVDAGQVVLVSPSHALACQVLQVSSLQSLTILVLFACRLC